MRHFQLHTVMEIVLFTPENEVDLCEHATLAPAHVLFKHFNYSKKSIAFYTKSGTLAVRKSSQWYTI